MQTWVDFFKRVFQEWNEDKVTRLAAALSYYTVFALAPLLVVVIAVAGLVLGTDVAQQHIVAQIQGLVGSEGAQLVNTLLNNARNLNTNILATVLGIAAIVLGATGVVGELKDSLNTIWNVAPKPENGLFGTMLQRVFSLGMVLGIGFMLLVSLVVSAALTALGTGIRGYFGEWVIVGQLLDLVISFGSVTLLFALLFKFLPDVKVAWRDVWVGSLVTALLFTIGKYALSLYLARGSVATPFGAAGSLVILFVWIYYAAQILFLGAEITQVYANEFGRGIQPNAHAVALSDAAKVEQGTKAPTSAPQPTVPQATAPEMQPQTVPQPLYMELPKRSFQIREGFNPLEMVSGAIGMVGFGWLERLFKTVQKPFRRSVTPRANY